MKPMRVNQKELSDADLNQRPMGLINEYVSEVNHPCSFNALAEDVLLAEDLLQNERCVIVAVPGRKAAEFPASDTRYGAVVMTRPDDLRQANLALRDGKISLPFHPFYARPHLELGRLLVIYQFDDSKILEIVPVTPELYEDLCVCDLTAQSKNHPTFAELESRCTSESEDQGVHVLDNRSVERLESES
jgi:hypothetical protein